MNFVFESSGSSKPCFWCSCPDFASNRAELCKHCWASFYTKKLNLVQQIDKKLPMSQVRNSVPKFLKSVTDQYKNESIQTLNLLEKAEIEAEQYRNQRQQSWELDDYDF